MTARNMVDTSQAMVIREDNILCLAYSGSNTSEGETENSKKLTGRGPERNFITRVIFVDGESTACPEELFKDIKLFVWN